MKNKRLSCIIDIITREDISTQEMLLKRLKECGFNVTQATVSRDINSLQLEKVSSDTGSRYALPVKPESLFTNGFEFLDELIRSSVIKIDHALNTVCIKCKSGMAQAVCARIDQAQPASVVGTLAGEDTIFILMRTENDASMLSAELNSLLFGKSRNK